MNSNVLLALSHKGGTGRSVTSANVAYRLALQGLDVCCVDLDLDSPTLGSVLGMREIERGVRGFGEANAPRSIGDVLDFEGAASNGGRAVRDTWEAEGLDFNPEYGRFDFVPGRANYRMKDELSVDVAANRLIAFFDAIGSQYDVIYADLRSGTSFVAETFTQPGLTDHIAGWLIHFRWTGQHLVGLEDLVTSLDEHAAEQVHLVRTAFHNPDDLRTERRRTWAQAMHSRMDDEFNHRIPRGHERLISTIPFEPLLQWHEQIVTDEDIERGFADARTGEAFDELAVQAEELVVGRR